MIPALAVQILCSRSSTPFPIPHSKKKNPNQTGTSETTKRDAFFRQLPPVHLASSDHVVCVCSPLLCGIPMRLPARRHRRNSCSHIPKSPRPGPKPRSFNRERRVCPPDDHLDSFSTILSTQESGCRSSGCLGFLPETLLADGEGELESSVFVCFKQAENARGLHQLSQTFLLRREAAGSPHETRIMGQLFGGAYYGMRTHQVSPSRPTHTAEAERLTPSQVIEIRRPPGYQSRTTPCRGFQKYQSGQVLFLSAEESAAVTSRLKKV